MRTRTAVVALSILLAAGSASAMDGVRGLLDGLVVPTNPPSRFVARKGNLEFTGRMIVRPVQPEAWMAAGLTAQAADAKVAEARARLAGALVRAYPEVDEHLIAVPKGVTENQVSVALMSTGLYQYAEPDWLCFPVEIPNDPKYGSQWQLPKLQAPAAWDITHGTDVILAICDSGLTHPDFNTVPGRNIPSNNNVTSDVNGHGTFCAGMAGAKGNNNLGVVGAGWNFRIMPVRVTNNANGSASLSNILAGGRWAADNGARGISASYSGVNNNSIQTTGLYIKGKNALYFYAAGNDGTKINGFDHKDVIVVGATTSSDTKAGFSNYGDLIDVTGPGYNVYSTVRPSSYGFSSGTSFSTPLANGVAGMIWSANAALTAQQVEEVLFASCKDLGTQGNDSTYGWGRVDLLNAVVLASSFGGVSVPFLEEFPEDAFDPTVWTDISGAIVTDIASNEPSEPFSMGLTGTGTVSTNPFDLEFGHPPVTITYWTQHKIVEQGKSLKVEYFNSLSDEWTLIESIVSNGVDQTQFVRGQFNLPPDGFGLEFRLRFTAVGGDGGDLWFVDDISVAPPSCTADLDGNGILDLFDFLAFQNLFANHEPEGDWDGNGVYDLFDFLAFQNSFVGGC